jgi:hypothetical protein
MFFDLNTPNPPTTFYYWENGQETEAWISLRLASEEDNRRFFNAIGVKEKVEKIFNPKTRQMERMTYFDHTEPQRDAFNDEIWDFSIVDWNILSSDKDEDGKPITIPCMRENKIKLMRTSPKFASWVANCLERLRENLEQSGVEERKN